MSHSKTPTKTKIARAKSRTKRPANPRNIPSGSTRSGAKQETVLPAAFPPRYTADPNSRRLGTSGVFAISDPSPSLDPAVLGPVEPNDRTRQSGSAAMSHAMIIAKAMCEAARGAHADPDLSLVEKHRAARERSARAALPLISTIEKAQAVYEKELTPLRAKLAAPAGDFSDMDRMDAMVKLRGMQPHARFPAIKKSIDKGSDLLAFILTRSDEFLVGDLLGETEKTVIVDHWRIGLCL